MPQVGTFPIVRGPATISRFLETVNAQPRPEGKVQVKNWIKGSGLTSSYFEDCVYLASFLGMLDQNGESQDLWARLRDSEHGREHLLESLRTGYAPILKFFGLTDVTAEDAPRLQSWLRTNANASAEDAVAAVATMIRLFDFASGRESAVVAPKASPSGNPKPKTKTATATAARGPRKIEVTTNKQETVPPNDGGTGRNDVALTINLSLEIPATENENVYEALFSSMAKHLGTLVSR